MKAAMIRNLRSLKYLKSLKSFGTLRTLGTLGTLRATLAGFIFLTGSFFTVGSASAAPLSDYPIFILSGPNYEPFFPFDLLPSEFTLEQSHVLFDRDDPPTEEELDPPGPVGGAPVHDHYGLIVLCCIAYGIYLRRKSAPTWAGYKPTPHRTNKLFNIKFHKTMKHLFYRVAAAISALLMTTSLSAQVTIGSNADPETYSLLQLETTLTHGGLRLPQLTTIQREALAIDPADSKAKGLTIYNTTTNCLEYWNATKWNSLCQGQAGITFTAGGSSEDDTPVDPTETPFPAAGEDRGPFIPHDIPECISQNPAYNFSVMTGGDYFHADIVNPSTGEFRARMDANSTAVSRNAILRITNNCTNEYKEFLFNQLGDDTGCGDPTVPTIKSYNPGESASLCADGAVYLYLEGLPAGDPFIWTLNGQDLGHGNTYTATLPGRYIVYSNKIGCPNKAEIQITPSESTAPAPVEFIVIGNNGVACGNAGEVVLVVTRPVSGNIVWYKDGQKQSSLNGDVIAAAAGKWQAVVEDGSCASRPTNPAIVTEFVGEAVGTPTIKVNGATAGYKLCQNGSMLLEVDEPDPNLSYTWYIDNTQIGIGTSLYYTVPSFPKFVLRLRATGSGCAGEAYSIETRDATLAPVAPVIAANTGNVLCGGQAMLSASGGDTYRWYKEGVEIVGQTASSIIVTDVAAYTVTAVAANGCTGMLSGAKVIAASDFAIASWIAHPGEVNTGDNKTYSVSVDYPIGVAYNWAVTGTGVSIATGQGTSAVIVHFGAVEPSASVSCTVTTACGVANSGIPLTQAVAVSDACFAPAISGTGGLIHNVKATKTTTLSIIPTGTAPLTFQWYNATAGEETNPVGTNAAFYEVPGSATTSAGSTLLYWCKVTNNCNGVQSVNSAQFTVNVTSNPATITPGTGSFKGKICFDIALGNDGENSCGSVSSRQSQQTVFTNRTKQDGVTTAPYSGVQVYTFTPTGTVSHVRFDYVEEVGEGLIIDSIVPQETTYAGAININYLCKVTVYYKTSLQTDLAGLTRSNAYKLKLYAIYNMNYDGSGGTAADRRLELTANLQDCACCGARTVDGGWLTFMCHNLGANENLDPFEWNNSAGNGNTTNNGVFDANINGANTYKDIKGYSFQWGRAADGHQYRNSATTTTRTTVADYAANPSSYTFFVMATGVPFDWVSDGTTDAGQKRWGEGSTTSATTPKRPNDPCPPGWKVPSQSQWQSIFKVSGYGSLGDATANTWSWTGNGYKVGDALYLPSAGYRTSSGSNGSVSLYGAYQSSTYDRDSDSYLLYFSGSNVDPGSSGSHSDAYSVRCVAE